jgi:hypothetical protein
MWLLLPPSSEPLVPHQGLGPKQLEKRAIEALRYYVGRTAGVELNLGDALRIVHDLQRELRQGKREQGHERQPICCRW